MSFVCFTIDCNNTVCLRCDFANQPGVLLEVCPQTQGDVVIFHHGLHVPCLGVRVHAGPLPKMGRNIKWSPPEKAPCNHTKHLPGANGATLRISSVIRRCLWWTSSCRFMSSSWCFRPSCGSLTNTSSSSINCDRKLWLNQHQNTGIYLLALHFKCASAILDKSFLGCPFNLLFE